MALKNIAIVAIPAKQVNRTDTLEIHAGDDLCSLLGGTFAEIREYAASMKPGQGIAPDNGNGHFCFTDFSDATRESTRRKERNGADEKLYGMESIFRVCNSKLMRDKTGLSAQWITQPNGDPTTGTFVMKRYVPQNRAPKVSESESASLKDIADDLGDSK